MMFSRDELGKMFQDRGTAAALPVGGASKANRPSDAAHRGGGTGAPVRLPGRYWPGQAAAVLEEEVVAGVFLRNAGGAAAAAPPAGAASPPAHAPAGHGADGAPVAPVARRRIVAAEVLLQGVESLGASDAPPPVDADDISARVAAALAARLEPLPAPEVSGAGETEEEVAARRARVRARVRAKAEVIEEAVPRVRAEGAVVVEGPPPPHPAPSPHESGPSWEAPSRTLVRPLFVPKAQRGTVREAEERERAEEGARRAAAAAAAARAEESRGMVVDALRREEAAAAAGEGNEEDAAGTDRPDDRDDPDGTVQDAEYEAWRLRELRRLTRDAEAAAAVVREAADTARRRGLTDTARAAEDAASGVATKVVEKWGFLQKYHHKGAFYVDESSVGAGDVRLRSAGGATGEDAIARDRSLLPAVMQVRNFGKKGRTRWTHLAGEDTTAFDDYHRRG